MAENLVYTLFFLDISIKKIVAGDLVILGGENEDIEEDVPESEIITVEDQDKKKEKEKDEDEIEEEKAEEVNKRDRFDPSKVIVLTEETKGNYSLHDIVVPLVGRDIPYKNFNS